MFGVGASLVGTIPCFLLLDNQSSFKKIVYYDAGGLELFALKEHFIFYFESNTVDSKFSFTILEV